MKKLLPLIFVTLLLAGCASQGSVDDLKVQNQLLQTQIEQQKQIMNLQNTIANSGINQQKESVQQPDQSFQKKQECAKYSNEIARAMKQAGGEELITFYSPKLDTCVYGWRTYEMTDPDAAAPESHYFLADALTKESLYFGSNDHPERERKIKELKGE